MPTFEDLKRAVEAGVLSDQQHQDLIAFLKADPAGAGAVARDEAPRFFRSFNDLFIGLGVAILGFALFTTAGLTPRAETFMLCGMFLLFAGLFWLLAEWITLKRRINFPSIVLAIFFGAFFLNAMKWGWTAFFMNEGDIDPFKTKDAGIGVFTIFSLTAVALGLFFWRFRLPFSILLFAASLLATGLTALFTVFGADAIQPLLRWIFLVAGLLIFATAMYFDFQDPLRTQRTSDHGFWLHLLAAPIITHSVLWSFLQPLVSAQQAPETTANLMVLVVLGLFLVFSIVALVIDRRALLISSLGYASAALGYILYKIDIQENLAFVLTLILIAMLILILGTGWYRLRRAVFKWLPSHPIYNKLPPLSNVGQ